MDQVYRHLTSVDNEPQENQIESPLEQVLKSIIERVNLNQAY